MSFLIKVTLSILLSAIIGYERELCHKAAGLRTNILVCLGAMFATYISSCLINYDITRIASNVLTGLGFIGGGVIIQAKGHIRGITTASCIWICGIIGMAIGFGYFIQAIIVSVLAFIVLFGLGKLEHYYKKDK